ncbi:hypothetical protein VB618_03390 [Microvirga sp. CF3062]|nr:hypothetical protein [Microvirga sp. CF3062]MEE1655228.1 hypothetical protein [Microvirga sp. CF3062]
MLCRIQRDRQQDISCRISDFQLPAAPIDLFVLAFLPQFLDRFDRLVMSSFQIRDFDACLIEDSFMRMHEMKETMHSKAALGKLFNRRT